MVFKAGQSGNPIGRPKGTKDRRSLFRDMVEPSCLQLVKKAIDMALEGNEQMLRLLLDRMLPAKPKDDPIDINLAGENSLGKAQKIFIALSKKKITASEATDLLCAVVAETKIQAIADFERRLEILEACHKAGIASS